MTPLANTMQHTDPMIILQCVIFQFAHQIVWIATAHHAPVAQEDTMWTMDYAKVWNQGLVQHIQTDPCHLSVQKFNLNSNFLVENLFFMSK